MGDVDGDGAAQQLLQLRQQNQELQQALAAKELEVKALKEIAAVQDEGSPAADKVIELSKKNRDLNLKLERERTKVAKLEQMLAEATAGKDSHVAQKVQAAARTVVEEAAGAADAAVKEVAALKERNQHQTNRIGQLEQKVFLLENESKKLRMALVREVGEEVPLARVLEEGSDWKGRREIIIALKDQLRQAKEQMAGKEVMSKVETSHKQSIIKLNKGRTAEADRAAAELAAAKEAMEKLQLAYHGSMSRRKVLETELAGLREKMAVVLNKTKNDDKLIATLRKELQLATKGGAKVDMSAKGAGYAELVELRERVVMQEEQIDQQQKIIFYLQGKTPPPTIFASPSSDGVKAQPFAASGGGFGAGVSAAIGSGAGFEGASVPAGAYAGATGGYPGAPAAAYGSSDEVESLRDENAELRMQVAALSDDLAVLSRPGTSSNMSVALREQVLALQEDIERLNEQMVTQSSNAPSRPESSKPATATGSKAASAAGSKAPSVAGSKAASAAGSRAVCRVSSKVGGVAAASPVRSARPSLLGGNGGGSQAVRSGRTSDAAEGAAAPFVCDADGTSQAQQQEAEAYEEGIEGNGEETGDDAQLEAAGDEAEEAAAEDDVFSEGGEQEAGGP